MSIKKRCAAKDKETALEYRYYSAKLLKTEIDFLTEDIEGLQAALKETSLEIKELIPADKMEDRIFLNELRE